MQIKKEYVRVIQPTNSRKIFNLTKTFGKITSKGVINPGLLAGVLTHDLIFFLNTFQIRDDSYISYLIDNFYLFLVKI